MTNLTPLDYLKLECNVLRLQIAEYKANGIDDRALLMELNLKYRNCVQRLMRYI